VLQGADGLSNDSSGPALTLDRPDSQMGPADRGSTTRKAMHPYSNLLQGKLASSQHAQLLFSPLYVNEGWDTRQLVACRACIAIARIPYLEGTMSRIADTRQARWCQVAQLKGYPRRRAFDHGIQYPAYTRPLKPGIFPGAHGRS
jgi:hypothetical protein